ncbi:Transmembrane E3 ubiquitin-protein ligase 1 [Smittium mucronatum]|uniref:Transmembrane E3 ubiquitin-protein ligase 1 n=1 Tax=Smittium mucronatum TaxID=133383 RepID=A0A1R0GYL0_9FUNG|nr:Transmembrane E3 ubiquitin-protein ligase 1 [Smittium mucronatum]
MPDSKTFNDSRAIIIDHYNKTFNDAVLEEDSNKDCEYFLLGKVIPVGQNFTSDDMSDIEKELENPTGKSMSRPPKMDLDLLVFSQNCNVVLTTKKNNSTEPLEGIKIQVYETKAKYASFLFSILFPETYNYHPFVSRNDEETNSTDRRDSSSSGLGIHNPSPINENDDMGQESAVSVTSKRCAICMLQVETESRSGLIGRASYMVTPCHHIFHTSCLDEWMRIKLECPVCRTPLPPI